MFMYIEALARYMVFSILLYYINPDAPTGVFMILGVGVAIGWYKY